MRGRCERCDEMAEVIYTVVAAEYSNGEVDIFEVCGDCVQESDEVQREEPLETWPGISDFY